MKLPITSDVGLCGDHDEGVFEEGGHSAFWLVLETKDSIWETPKT